MIDWQFKDPPNVAVIVHRKIINDGDWIAYVSHDAIDGGWQFQNNESGPVKESDAALVSLRSIMQIDESIAELLVDLPQGWHAWRDSKESSWHRAKVT